MTWFRELKRRHVVQVAIAYAAAAFVVLQAGEMLADGLSLPRWVFPAIFVAVVLGFPIALVLAWAYELTPGGVRREGESPYDPTQGAGQAANSLPRDPPQQHALAPSEPGRSGTTLSGMPRVAVLPFANMGASAEDEYFSDGITEDIIAQLSLISSLRVISRTSVMRYKQATRGMGEIAAELGATHVVEGSVRRAGDRVRIVAQLIEASADAHLWSETFDRGLTDVFAIQSEVAGRIAGALRRKLSPDEERRLIRRPTNDPEAYDLFLLARHNWNSGSGDGFARAEKLCERAIARDPAFARAWAAVAVANSFHIGGYFGVRPRDAAARIERYATRALELDPELAEAHMMLSYGPFCHYDWEAARVALERALALNPSLPEAHLFYANYLMTAGRFADALDAVERARALDPAAEIVHMWGNWILYLARQYEQALKGIERAEAEYGPGMITTVRQELLVTVGRAEEAVRVARDLCERFPLSLYRTNLAWSLAAAHREPEAREVLAQLHALEATEYVWPVGIAIAYAHLRELDRAFEYLERCYADGVGWMQVLHGPPFDPFRGDPRFQGMIRRVGVKAPAESGLHLTPA